MILWADSFCNWLPIDWLKKEFKRVFSKVLKPACSRAFKKAYSKALKKVLLWNVKPAFAH